MESLTSFHLERFYSASNEKPCSISMREYVSTIIKPLVDVTHQSYEALFNSALAYYSPTQEFGKKIHEEKHWGLVHPSIRNLNGLCHLRYIWDGQRISEVYKESKIANFKSTP